MHEEGLQRPVTFSDHSDCSQRLFKCQTCSEVDVDSTLVIKVWQEEGGGVTLKQVGHVVRL